MVLAPTIEQAAYYMADKLNVAVGVYPIKVEKGVFYRFKVITLGDDKTQIDHKSKGCWTKSQALEELFIFLMDLTD